MKKKIAVGIICAVVAWVVIGVIDFTMVNSYHKPVFCVGAELADDGGSGTYVGLGYSFDIEGNFMPEAENPGVTSYRGYIFGIEVIRGFRDEMLSGVDNESLGATEEIEVVPNDTVLTEPPALTVVCGDKTVEALRGTTSWMYQNEDGTGTGIESDSMHPLQAKEYMTPLELIPTTISSIDPLIAYLQWNTIPDKVLVRCWSEEHWEQPTAESKEIPVSTLMIDSNIETTPIISVELKDGNYIYEVVAEWNSAEKYSGTAYYSFYTANVHTLEVTENSVGEIGRETFNLSVEISEDDAHTLSEIINNGTWKEEPADCESDCVINLKGHWTQYDSENGILNKYNLKDMSVYSSKGQEVSGKSLVLSEEDRITVNAILEKYITLGIESN